MNKSLFLVAVLIIVLMAPAAIVGATDNNEIAASQIPVVVAALEEANSQLPAGQKISSVTALKSVDQFIADHQISDPRVKDWLHQQQAFTAGYKEGAEIYVVMEVPNFQLLAERFIKHQPEGVVFEGILAAMLVHEAYHLHGETDEVPHYKSELAVLKSFRSSLRQHLKRWHVPVSPEQLPVFEKMLDGVIAGVSTACDEAAKNKASYVVITTNITK